MKFLLGAFLIFGVGILGVSLSRAQVPCANTGSCEDVPSLRVDNGTVGTFAGVRFTPPQIDLTQDQRLPVLGTTTGAGTKHIYVDLEKQTLYAYEGDQLYFQTLVSTGRWGRTPTGEYRIWVKIRSTRMSGGSGSDAYDLPNVPYVMFFYNREVPKQRGYSFHGVYWHNNFGHTMSHGCVNMRTIDAKKLYEWANPTTRGATTHATTDDEGTGVSICNHIEITGGLPQCLE